MLKLVQIANFLPGQCFTSHLALYIIAPQPPLNPINVSVNDDVI